MMTDQQVHLYPWFSGSLFLFASILAPQTLGWQRDEWILIPLAVAHLALVLMAGQKLNRSFMVAHYLLAAGALLALSIPARIYLSLDSTGWQEMTLRAISSEWSSLQDVGRNLLYLAATLAIALGLVKISRSARRLRRSDHGPAAALFAFSVLLIPCDFALFDVLAQVGAERPEEAGAMVIASFISSLVKPISVHVLVLLALLAGQAVR